MPLKTIGTIAILDAEGSDFDHAAFDARSRRIFIAHTARDCVEVIDYDAGDNSTNTLDVASPSFSAFRWSWKAPLAWLAGIALGWERRCQHRQLLELDDRLLADMGLSRPGVEEVRRSTLYMMAWRDSR
jgi:uncharacterized protein YjiS (DUF1127 family)